MLISYCFFLFSHLVNLLLHIRNSHFL
jgi:hypothetical protein